jgi:hypothetical protein
MTPAVADGGAGVASPTDVPGEAAVRAQLLAEAEQLRAQLAGHDAHTLALQDRVYAAERAGDDVGAAKLAARLHKAVTAGQQMSVRLQELGTDAIVGRRVQAAQRRARDRARLDSYLASKEV